MTDQTNATIDTAAQATAKAATAAVDAAAETAKTVRAETAKVAAAATPKAAKPAARRSARKTSAAKASPRKTRTARKIRAAAKPARASNERNETVKKTTNNNRSAYTFGAFDAFPTFAPFQNMVSDANERGQGYARKSQKVTEELADLARANIEAMVEAGRIAATGARSLGQDVIATGRDGIERASDAVRSLAEAKSPTEYMQLQGEFARASFDRMVAESSKLTEIMVKLAGEAFQPLQNRASANAERLNSFVA